MPLVHQLALLVLMKNICRIINVSTLAISTIIFQAKAVYLAPVHVPPAVDQLPLALLALVS